MLVLTVAKPTTIAIFMYVHVLYTYDVHEVHIHISCLFDSQRHGKTPNMTGSEKTRLSGIFYISRNTSFKYSSHSGSLMPNCRDATFTA